jgi:hypothetical protein
MSAGTRKANVATWIQKVEKDCFPYLKVQSNPRGSLLFRKPVFFSIYNDFFFIRRYLL